LHRQVKEQFNEILRLGRNLSPDTLAHIGSIEEPGQLADFLAYTFSFKIEDKQALLETLKVSERLKKLSVLLDQELELMKMQQRISSEVKGEIDKNQREYFLREQMKAIQKELGEVEGSDRDEISELRERIEQAGMPPQVQEEAERELSRLERMHPDAAEASVIRTYLDWLIEMPWNVTTEDNLDIKRASGILNQDHYGLDKVKDRILEFLSVRKLKMQRLDLLTDPNKPASGDLPEELAVNKGPILCFVGPPGVGKTSIAESIAKSLGRKFIRISLGGARDESDIRGHRRTYIGAMPGRIVQGIRQAGTKNPVFLLDEVDKLGVSFQGDPSAALLEVLDPAQNKSFVDHYLNVAFDLSEVMFITTANYANQIPAPLLDRMELIEFTGYIEQEKLEIAKRYLVPKQIKENGLTPEAIKFSDGAILHVINAYTRESGVRNLEREIGTLCRKVARQIAEGQMERAELSRNAIHRHLGPERYRPETEAKENRIGLATGMYYTPMGGDIMFVETTIMKGKGSLLLTGQLGDIMKESAQAALSYARSHAKDLAIPDDLLTSYDIHVHVPAGAMPKEGPSAGIALAAAIISSLTSRPVRHDVAMTGEVTLQGRVLPIGGLKEKVLGARRAGIRAIILPKANEVDLNEIPKNLRRSMTFTTVDQLEQVLDFVLLPPQLQPPKKAKRPPRTIRAKQPPAVG
ncbi:MAG: endopeptidase La, partial [Deinococcus sp.]|nr:endopeptidase La [Deinococcus sp.]